MAIDYFAKAELAERKITEAGRVVQIVTATPADPSVLTEDSWFDPDPVAAPDTITSTDASAVQITMKDAEGNALIDTSERRYLLAASAAITTGDKIEDHDGTFDVTDVEETRPGPTLLLQRVRAVRG